MLIGSLTRLARALGIAALRPAMKAQEEGTSVSRVLGTESEVLALSPDAASSKAAKGLQSLSKWPVTGCNESAAWGECQGSGSKPYQTQVDLSGPSFKCSCPSRKFPCKHGLALMLLRANGQMAEGGDPPAWVQAWLDSRQEKAEKKEARAAAAAAAPPPDPETAARQQARREDKRWDKIGAGLQELSLWMQDMVRAGLASQAGNAQARQRWSTMAARMVDAQATGMAARIKEGWELVDSHAGWPRDLLVQLGHWQLIVDAVQRREQLSPEVRADVMAALGWPMDKAEVQASGPQVDDEWLVAGLRTMEREGRLMERRVWLQGLHTGRTALVLDYAQGGRGFESAWVAGARYRCALHFYPGRSPLRAIAAQGNGPALAEPQSQPLAVPCAQDSLWQLGRRIAANPLQPMQPLWCADARLVPAEGQWFVAWPGADGQALPVPAAIGDADAWQLLALSGGEPLRLFGEWEPGAAVGRWRLLSAWRQGAGADARCMWHNRGEIV